MTPPLRRLLLAAVIVMSLGACREDDDRFSQPTPTPTPSPRPSPTPDNGTDDGLDGDLDADADGDGIPDSDDLDSGSATPTPTPLPDGSNEPLNGGTQEVVRVTQATAAGSTTTIYVDRANGEVWILTLEDAPAVNVGDNVLFASVNRVFGDPAGTVTFATGIAVAIEQAVRVR